jgi:hypothetical protein
VAVLDPDERLLASASFVRRSAPADGWMFRNALLAQLRRVIPHDLRRRTPVRTAVLLYCREGDARWTEEDGAWMWGLRDACTLHGLRCGAYITLTRDGWQVLGEGRGGRRPSADSAPEPFAMSEVPPLLPRTGGAASEVLRRARPAETRSGLHGPDRTAPPPESVRRRVRHTPHARSRAAEVRPQ